MGAWDGYDGWDWYDGRDVNRPHRTAVVVAIAFSFLLVILSVAKNPRILLLLLPLGLPLLLLLLLLLPFAFVLHDQGLSGDAEKSVSLKGTASAVPKVLCSQRGFSRWGTLFVSRGPISRTLFSPAYG